MSGHQQHSWSAGGPSSSGPVIRRSLSTLEESSPTAISSGGDGGFREALQPGGALEGLVDAVVERVEQRVIDELERRGRRQDWAAF